MTEETKPTGIDRGQPLIEKLADVMAQIERVPKRGHNDFFNYDYVTEADLVAHIRPLLAAAGIMIIPSVIKEKTDYEVVAERNGKSHLTRLMVEYTITDGKEIVTYTVPGFGVDRADKGVYKALTGSMKYALMKLFLVDTGDDPELTRESADQGVSISSSQEEGIQKGGRSKNTTRYQLQRIVATMREKAMARTDLLAVIAELFGVELVMPENDEDAQRVIVQFLSQLESDQAGELIGRLEDWSEPDATA